jgi:hypothetical protein
LAAKCFWSHSKITLKIVPISYYRQAVFLYSNQGPYEKMTIFFGLSCTHNNKIHTIYKQSSVVVLVLLAKQQQQKIVTLYTISEQLLLVVLNCNNIILMFPFILNFIKRFSLIFIKKFQPNCDLSIISRFDVSRHFEISTFWQQHQA